MKLNRIWLHNFRSYDTLELPLSEGLTALIGPNGIGKTNIVEAVTLLSTLKSFRGSPTESLIRRGCNSAVVRAEGERDGRPVLIEVQLGGGKTKVQVNRQRLRRSRDLLGALRATVFGPDDLSLVKDGPSVRRDFLDDLLVSLDPSVDRLLSEVAKIIRQRTALLRTNRGSLDESALVTLDVWDQKLAQKGSDLSQRRLNLVDELLQPSNDGYEVLAGEQVEFGITYRRSWTQSSLAEALNETRSHDMARGVTSVGPHRDDIQLTVNGFSSRTEVSQGEQRSVALALRLAGHTLVTNKLGESPLLLLDDVLSELDPQRCERLLSYVPPGQTLLTSASELPPETQPTSILAIADLVAQP